MEKEPAGEAVRYTVTYLEMAARPITPIAPMPIGMSLALIETRNPPPEYFLYLYTAVGAAYEWTYWLGQPQSAVTEFLADPKVELFTLMIDGWPGGFFILDTRDSGTCSLDMFGLVPQAVGRGLGAWFLGSAIHMGWDRPNVTRMTVDTNTLDHPRALALYQRMGFVPVRREEMTRRLSRPREA